MQKGGKSKSLRTQWQMTMQNEADGLQPALVTYFTAGYPTPEETVDILLGMEAGGSGMKAN
jgi:tryptophan synthase alpha subunit